MSVQRNSSAVIAAAMLALCAGAFASESSAPLAAPKTPDPFKHEPEPWRAYFDAARKAERHADALDRCLAYPDLPGTQWPAGYAAAHCHYHLARVPSVADVDALISAGRLGELERIVSALIAAHDVDGPERENIHRFFQQFSEDPEDGVRITEQWVKQAPGSTAALVAYGSAVKGAGWKARGGNWARETSELQMRIKTAYFDQAESAFRDAIAREPTWIHPYIGLMDIGKSDRDEVGEWGFAQANALDPGCGELVYRRMQSLEPRWGGSWAAMEAYAKEIAHHVERRPLLANQLSQPMTDFVAMLDDEHDNTPKVRAMLEHAVQISGLEAALHAAADANLNPKEGDADPRRAVAMLLQESRFQPVNPWADRAVGSYFVQRDPVWARHVLKRAVERQPDNAYGQYFLGAANFNSGHFEEAEAHYLAAAESPDHSKNALSELSGMWLLEAGLAPDQATARARPFVERLLKAHPDHPDARYLVIALQALTPGGSFDEKAIRAYLAVAPANDPRHARRRKEMLKLLESMKEGPSPGTTVQLD